MTSLKEELSFYKAGFPKNYRHLLVRKAAKLWLKLNPQLKIIGIVGSYGKTTIARVAAAFLGLSLPTLKTKTNLDTIYNLPLTILKIHYFHRYLVLEMGVDHQGEMAFHLDLVRPEILVFSGLTPVHAEKELLGSFSGIKKEKGKAIEAVIEKGGWIVANKDDLEVQELLKEKRARKVVWYGIDNDQADWQAKKITIDKKGTSFILSGKEKEIKIRGRFWGRGYVAAFLAAAALGDLLKLPERNLLKTARNLTALSSRLSLGKGPGGCFLLDDHLRANPASARLGLETLAQLPVAKKGRKIVVLGEMGELGEYAKAEHQKAGELLEKFKFDWVIGIGPLLKETRKKTKLVWVKDPLSAAEELEKLKLKPADILYLKGSLLKHLERILLFLEGKKVGCRVLSCHLYNPCGRCSYLKSGFN